MSTGGSTSEQSAQATSRFWLMPSRQNGLPSQKNGLQAIRPGVGGRKPFGQAKNVTLVWDGQLHVNEDVDKAEVTGGIEGVSSVGNHPPIAETSTFKSVVNQQLASVEAAVFDEVRVSDRGEAICKELQEGNTQQKTHGKVGVLQPDLDDPVERLAVAPGLVLERALREARIVGHLYTGASRGPREALRCSDGGKGAQRAPETPRVMLCKAAMQRAGAGGAARSLPPALDLACVTLCKAATRSSRARWRTAGLTGFNSLQGGRALVENSQ
ncbi:hypothetical protein B0H14DRAFT_2613833 [Mycena olivaceomarginata]|nr:hypothetical protein B0H14DRAFT_2613833 [Mycena olivaceomarginata]